MNSARIVVPFTGYKEEKSRLAAAIASRTPVLLTGRRFSGKTRLIDEVLGENRAAVRADWPPSSRRVLETLAARLACGNPAGQTSLRLRGLVWAELERNPRIIVIENVTGSSAQAYRFFQRIFHTPGVVLIATATTREQIGYLGRLFWEPGTNIVLNGLSRGDAGALAANAMEAFGIDGRDAELLRDEVLPACRGNPGCILDACRMASETEYRTSVGLKLHLMRIDLAPLLTA